MMSVESRESWRVFCALELPREIKTQVGEHVARLREAAPQVKASWERTEKLHITLKFLGEVERERVASLARAAQATARAVAPFSLAIEGTGVFPPRGLPRVLWVGITDESRQLSRLQQQLEDECARENFPREKRAFHPHLTVARLRSPDGARRLAEIHTAQAFPQMTFAVNKLLVVRSTLGPGGSRYSTIAESNLESEV